MNNDKTDAGLSGRCYCGATRLKTAQWPETVAYCHCIDCRRVTGAPVAAFAAFDANAVTVTSGSARSISKTPGITRTFCAHCGSPLTGRYDYLPGKLFIAIGILDQADQLAPQLHAHAACRLPWLHIQDNCEQVGGSARGEINSVTNG